MEIDEEYKDYMQDIVKSLPATIFFKDTEGKYVFTTKTCDLFVMKLADEKMYENKKEAR